MSEGIDIRPWLVSSRCWHPRLRRYMDAGEVVPACVEGPWPEGTAPPPGLWLATYGDAVGGSDAPLVAVAGALGNATKGA